MNIIGFKNFNFEKLGLEEFKVAGAEAMIRNLLGLIKALVLVSPPAFPILKSVIIWCNKHDDL